MAYSKLGIRYMQAIEDWKAPFEVAAILGDGRSTKTVSATLHAFVGRGLAEHHRGNNTFRLTDVGKAELQSHLTTP